MQIRHHHRTTPLALIATATIAFTAGIATGLLGLAAILDGGHLLDPFKEMTGKVKNNEYE